MGFYGNITNVSRTQFQFDRIYSNRVEMEKNKLSDGIFIGRHVLIEYDQNGLDSMKQVQFKDGKAYYNPKGTTGYQTLLTTSNTNNPEVVYVVESDESHSFYIYKGETFDEIDKAAKFTKVINDQNAPAYTINYNIDRVAYDVGRGYDSTAWQKVFSNQQESYVMIAELNTVVPTFDVVADAPTMNPIVPHFDTQSTNVYYKLHWQAPWGFRVADAEETQSDEEVTWTTYKYNEATNTHTESNSKKNGAIFYNKDAFQPQVGTPSEDIKKHAPSDIKNEIKITPTGKSGNKYSKHDGTSDTAEAEDIQELTINLPAIGNMMSDAWDIIHGPNRDNSMAEFELNEDGDKKLDKNGKPIRIDSLQGRLDSIAALGVDEIPVKRDSDGSLVGSKINGGKIPGQIIDLTGVNDDAWIRTVVDHTTQTINIHHKFDDNKNGNTILDLRQKVKNSGNTKDTTNDIDLNDGSNSFNITTPIVDSMGHVVAKNTETVTLPYGFKTITVGNESESASEVAAAAGDVVANNTQGTLTINPGNKWIHIGATPDEDIITLSHEINDIEKSDKELTDLNNGINTITIQDTQYDNAGHVTHNQKHTYILPYGYKTFSGDTGTTTADNTQDIMTVTGDNWITTTVSDDSIAFSHIGPVVVTATKLDDITPKFGETFEITDWYYDEKGHKSNNNTHTVKIPKGSLTDAQSNQADVITQLSFVDSTGALSTTRTNISNLLLTDYSKKTNNEDISNTDALGDALSKLQTQIHDTETVINNLDYLENADNTKIITQITQVDGKITNVARAAAGTLELGNEYKISDEGGAITAQDSLNSAFGKVEKNLSIEKARAEQAEANVLGEAKAYTDAAKKAILTGESTAELKEAYDTLVEIQAWIEGDGVNTTELTTAIADEANRAKGEESRIEGLITSEAFRAKDEESRIEGLIIDEVNNRTVITNELRSAAYKEESYFISKSQYDADMQTKDAQINGLNFEAKRLTNEVNALTTQIQELVDIIGSLQTRIDNLENSVE